MKCSNDSRSVFVPVATGVTACAFLWLIPKQLNPRFLTEPAKINFKILTGMVCYATVAAHLKGQKETQSLATAKTEENNNVQIPKSSQPPQENRSGKAINLAQIGLLPPQLAKPPALPFSYSDQEIREKLLFLCKKYVKNSFELLANLEKGIDSCFRDANNFQYSVEYRKKHIQVVENLRAITFKVEDSTVPETLKQRVIVNLGDKLWFCEPTRMEVTRASLEELYGRKRLMNPSF